MISMVLLLKMSEFSTFVGKIVVRFSTSVVLKCLSCICLHIGMQIKKLRHV